MSDSVKKILGTLLPVSLHPRTIAKRRLERATRAATILAGPFSGMKYVTDSVGSMWWPKVLGSYELELAGVINDLCLSHPRTVVDVGAAEGYYAIGMAWKCPQTKVVAFEGEASGRKLQAELADLNGVSARLQIEGFCDAASFQRTLAAAGTGLIICDIEGGERDLLDPSTIPELTAGRWTLLVEIHDFFSTDIVPILTRRFKATHEIEEITTRARAPRDLPESVQSAWLSRWTTSFMDERRPGPMRWLVLRPKA